MIERLNDRLADTKRREGGFTLIELLVVIIILGILAAVVVFAITGVGDKGQSAASSIDKRTVQTAEEAFRAKNGRYGTEAELVAAGLLSAESDLHDVVLGNNGPGGGIDSSYVVTCDVTANPACGQDGEIPLGGTLVVAGPTSAPSASLNPAINSEGGLHSNSEDMFNGLLRYETDGSIGGDLAQTFTFNNAVPSASNPNCPPTTGSATCDATTTVATFVLREGVKFHNGDTLDADDVVFSFEKAILAAHGRTRAINPTLGVTGSQGTTVVPPEAITTLPASPGNGGTVIFNLRQIFAPLRFTLNVTEAPIISETAYGPCFPATLFSVSPPNACPANTSPVGTGPFKFTSLSTTEIITDKNPDYFRTDSNGIKLPYLDRLVKKVIASTATASALQSGSVDVAGISPPDRPLFETNPNFVLTQTPRGSGGGNCITTISFNTTKRQPGAATVAPAGPYAPDSPYYGQNKPGLNDNAPPHQILGDAAVREAIFKSLDRNKFWTDVAFSAGRVADAPVHSIFQPNGAYQGAQPLPTFDRTAADALLDAAGWSGPRQTVGTVNVRTALDHPNETNPDPQLAVPDGTLLNLEYLAATGNELFAAEVESQLGIVGIDVTQVIGNNTAVVAPRLFNARTYDMGQISYCNNDEPQFGVRRQYHTDQLVQTNAFTNASGYKSTMMDQLWLDASKAPDTATYQAKFLQIQRLALGLSTPGGPVPTALETNQRIPMVQMLESAGTRGYRASCTGFNNNNTGLYMEAVRCVG